MPLDSPLVLEPLIGMAGVQRITYPLKDLVVKVQAAQKLGCFCQFKIDQARQLNFDQGLKPVF
jgi:hypothetical protein